MGEFLNKGKKVLNSELFKEVTFNADDRRKVYILLEEKKRSRNFFRKGKRILIPVCFTVLLLLTTNLFSSNPVLALSKIPFFETIFQFLGDSGLNGTSSEENQSVQQQQTENGINMEIQEAVYDGKRLSISYAIKSEKPIKNFTSSMVNAYIPLTGLQKEYVISNDHFEQVSDYEVFGYSTFTYATSEMPEEINVDFLYRGTTDFLSPKQKQFKFIFDIPIKKTSKMDTIAINKKQIFGEEELILNKISVSPISTALNIEYKVPYRNNQEVEAPSIRLLDQDGRLIKNVTNGSEWTIKEIKQENKWYTLREANLLFEPLDKEIKELKIQLFKNKNIEDSVHTRIKSIGLNEAENQILGLGERGTMKISDIEQEGKSAIIRYEYNSKFAFYQNFSPLVLKDANGNWYHGIEKDRKYLGNDTYIVEEMFLDLPKDKLAVRYLQEKAPELIEELEIVVSSDQIYNGDKTE
ncbi:DUF4179 domain-containing protein [Cytobacillus oceanisediminis]|uniref:DUF4179 domain-containing protein n=1 Tax=Cytobacillus oceanisediminis TaxID=665099 RepID=UPI00203EF8A9|nr:DUF4179 domain-containing protein [Cytobacillus oceanisediminis]MCM3393155.1 DUF4179 domain-containing protein [Cytobacillus oceanisediminis]